MGKIRKVQPVKLFIGFIFKDETAFAKAKSILRGQFGRMDYESEPLAFTYTDYYKAEFGESLTRKFISFQKLISPDALPGIKTNANLIEEKLSKLARRLINIDPGYLDMPKVILASTKDYRHRVYLGKGIFAEIALFYKGKSFSPWEWSYPDYKSKEYITIFNQIRELYAAQINNK